MQALLYPEYGRLVVTDVPDPAAAPGEVLVRVAGCGICGSELGSFASRSPRRQPPIVMGHEFAGRIQALGEGVERWRVGDRVAVNALVHCGDCAPCRRGDSHLCRNRQVFGMHRQGAFADLVSAPAKVLFPLPDSVPDVQAALIEPLANAVHVLNLAGRKRLESVLVFGGGTIGLFCLQAVLAAGAERVAVVEVNPARRDTAAALGATETLTPGEAGVDAFVSRWTGGEGVDLAIDAVGTPDARRSSVTATRPGGDTVWIGLHEDEISLSSYSVVLPERRVLGSYGATESDIEESIRLLAAGLVKTDGWVEALPLEQGDQVFLQMLRQERECVKAVLVPRQ